jgi:hypothetical protein
MGNQLTRLAQWWNPANTAVQTCTCGQMATYSKPLKRAYAEQPVTETLVDHQIPMYFRHSYYKAENSLDENCIALASCSPCLTEADKKYFTYASMGISILPTRTFVALERKGDEKQKRACWS